jgi:hypothetical protein
MLRELNGVQGERRGLVLGFERAFIRPHGDLFSGQAVLSKELPVLGEDSSAKRKAATTYSAATVLIVIPQYHTVPIHNRSGTIQF